MNIVIIIVIILIIILLLCIGKKYFKGGLTTYISDDLAGVDYITDLFNNIELFAKEYRELQRAKNLNPDLIPKKYLYYNIGELYRCIDDKYSDIIISSPLNYECVLCGAVEACVYLASYSHGLDNFAYNKIECEKTMLGGYNMVFICKITPYNIDGESLDCEEKYALRVLYNARADSLEYTQSLKKLMNEPEYEKYFMKPICGHVNFEKFNTSPESIKTSWNLFKLCKPIRTSTANYLKYLNTAFKCLTLLHKNELCYKDWKIENVMEYDDEYILTDVDFSFDNAPYSIRHRAVERFLIEQGYRDFHKLNYALDNVIALISWLQIANRQLTGTDTYKYYDYYEDTINRNMLNFLKSCEDIDDSEKFYNQIREHYLFNDDTNIRICFMGN